MLALLLGLVPMAPAAAQAPAGGRPHPLALEEALRIAEEKSEAVRIAEAAVKRARGDQIRARAERLPQLYALLSYDRALASEFEGVFGGDGGGAGDSTGGSSGLDFSELPFGRENTYRLGLAFSQNLFAGGRLVAQSRLASGGRDVAAIALESARAQIALEVAKAYYDAALADRLFAIAEATLEQAEATLAQTRLAQEVGNLAEFELLRAQVLRDTQRPVVIQRRSERDLAQLRLKQLLDLPAETQLALVTELDGAAPPLPERFAKAAGELDLAQVAATRAPVRQAEEAVLMRKAGVELARSQRFPSLTLNSQYGRVAYPLESLPRWDETRANWTVGLSLQLPLLTGGRIYGDELVAQANLEEAEARLQQARELALLDTRSVQDQLEAAEAAWTASAGTVEQAEKAYRIAELRYQEGVSTQVELSDARILLQQAQSNRVQAARDLQIARIRLALLPHLPVGIGGGTIGGGAPAEPQQQLPVRQQPSQRQAAGATMTSF